MEKKFPDWEKMLEESVKLMIFHAKNFEENYVVKEGYKKLDANVFNVYDAYKRTLRSIKMEKWKRK